MSKEIFSVLLISSLVFSGCSSLVPERFPVDDAPVMETFSKASVGKPKAEWWKEFGDNALNDLINAAFKDNLSLEQAAKRVIQARESAVKAGSTRLPNLDFNSSITRSYTDLKSGPSTNSTTWLIGLQTAYEVDLFGRVSDRIRAAEHDYNASIHDLNSAALALAAETASRRFSIAAEAMALRVLESQIESGKTQLELIQFRSRQSLASALEVYQQESVVASLESQKPLFQSRLKTQQHELAVLLGQPPRSDLPELDSLPKLPPFPATGIPVDLLFNRPDVKAGAERLLAADRRLGISKADLLPAVRLTGGISTQSGHWQDLFDDLFANLAAGLTAPLFDAGLRKAEIRRVKAVLEERLAFYKQTVLHAMKEVENTIAAEDGAVNNLKGLKKELSIAEKTLEEARVRYMNGLGDYLNVITALTNKQRLERSVITARRDVLLSRAALYKALGGGFQLKESLEND